jgi:hypothetical protein
MKRKTYVGAYLAGALLVVALGPGANDADSKRRAPKPDLVVSLISSAPSTTPGAKIRLALVIRNLGRVHARPSQAGLYISRDRRKSKDDLLLGKARVRALRAGQRARKTPTVRVPQGIQQGSRFLLACADAPNRLRERAERNNCRSQPFAIQSPKPPLLPPPPPPPPLEPSPPPEPPPPAPPEEQLPAQCRERPHPPAGAGEEAWASAAVATLEGASPATFTPASANVSFALSCPILRIAPDDPVVVLADGWPVSPDQLVLTPSRVGMSFLPVQNGRLELDLYAHDRWGFSISGHAVLWVGAAQQVVRVIDEAGDPVAGAQVQLRLGDEPSVRAQAITAFDGRVAFSSLPARTANVFASDASNRIGFRAVAIGAESSEVTVPLVAMRGPSPIDNNDFSLGTAGWEIGSAPVELIPHTEGPLDPAPAAPVMPYLGLRSEAHARLNRAPALLGAGLAAAGEDMDLQISTSGEGRQGVSRTFELSPGTKSVRVRYRFVTSEVPGGYFGTKYNDTFDVAVRSEGDSVRDGNSMNALGRGSFDGAGATAWFETELETEAAGSAMAAAPWREFVVAADGGTIQVDAGVANVSDDLLDSQLVIDIVEQKKLRVANFFLYDAIKHPTKSYEWITVLDQLSASNHTFHGGNTRVWGEFKLEGDAETKVTEVILQVLEGGNVIADAELPAAQHGEIYTKFGDDETIESRPVNLANVLFEIPGGELATANQDTNGNVTLRLVAKGKDKDDKEEKDEEDFGSVAKVTRFTADDRYGDPNVDAPMGGDQWALPNVLDFVGDLPADYVFGDMSNMNAGPFPTHDTHMTGQSIDTWFPGYNNRDAADAQRLINLLNDDALGSRIRRIYVTYTNAFQQAIQGVVLDDGRQATAVFGNEADHDTHFHLEVSP